MKFTHTTDGVVKTYTIEFQRKHKTVRVKDAKVKGVWHSVRSKYPYTYVEVRELADPTQPHTKYTVLAQAEQGCCPIDTFRLEEGRLRALKKLTPKLPAELRPLLWDCYHGRERKPKKGGNGGATPVEQPRVVMATLTAETPVASEKVM